MAQLLLVSNDVAAGAERSLPVLALLPHDIHLVGADTQALTESARADLVVLDGRSDLAGARMMARLFQSSGSTVPLLLVLAESGLAAVAADWGISDMVLDTCGPAEFEARIRLLVTAAANDGLISSGGIVIDDAAYSVMLDGEPLDLTYTEFELLKYLVQHPGRVFSREHLLADVWGYDYYGGTRTVDVHVRRLRAKLGPEHEALIGTVRNVGYRFSPDAGVRR
ncbi:MAG: response regulator transcription factor [Actinobacteria bacterium]|mgnify:FL=1|uniref:response regulator transcription factor n=1 Tax=Propionicimonas sp. T2.31MG-18 TaxID=3157620 RepID=UPI0035ED121D|nr:response regulator transcription factor [Actinomycetota bacterium]MCA0306520.1 response regulator transcription factor [Actinomycetota bacterium]